MKKPSSVRCENCMFYTAGKDPNKKICVFNPPDVSDGVAGFPVVLPGWWCGRFKPVDNLTAIEWVAWQKGLEEDAKLS
jgi:hypothetical protein